MRNYLNSGPFSSQCHRVKLKSSLGFDPLLKDTQGNKSKLDFIVENTTSLKYSEQYKVRETYMDSRVNSSPLRHSLLSFPSLSCPLLLLLSTPYR
jgi:hypothetical protein